MAKTNEIREYFEARKADINDRCGHPMYNNSMLIKVGNKYLYFLYKASDGSIKTIKKNMEQYYADYCTCGF